MKTARKRQIALTAGMGLLALLVLPFTLDAVTKGLTLWSPGTVTQSRFFTPGGALSNPAIFGHMVLGGVLSFLILLQPLPVLRRHLPAVHGWMGRGLVLAAFLTALGGLFFIALRGTIGGLPMDVGFTLYGLLMEISAVQTIRMARAGRIAEHRDWALRLLVLALGSWLYRVHYGIWYAITGGIASTPTFDGTFDLVQNGAFYLPYLLVLELVLRRRRARSIGHA
ncbi:DUF2306 domain-containing protein [uncultured Roseobacter sp.]|uniref:DUF2306 domain-containing protein n=1 Tax=uncultured Roseobacter sp. TaxID=114847 RepID=UPI0026329DAF|nr:DUF2306 domain-containing protein [uncultured Roseobacter sp.]